MFRVITCSWWPWTCSDTLNCIQRTLYDMNCHHESLSFRSFQLTVTLTEYKYIHRALPVGLSILPSLHVAAI